MSDRLSTTSHAVLGLLSIAPMSGYDLFQAVDRTVSQFWPISKTQVYAELARMEPLGLIRGTDVPQERLPDKRVFQLTEPGEEALDTWLADTEMEEPQFRVPFLLKAMLGHRHPPENTAALLREVGRSAAAQAAMYDVFLGELSAPDAAYGRIAVLFGLRIAETIQAWADEAEAMLPGTAFRIDPRRPEPRTARAMFRAAPAGPSTPGPS